MDDHLRGNVSMMPNAPSGVMPSNRFNLDMDRSHCVNTIVCFGEMLLRIGAPGADPLLRTPALAGYVGGAEANVAVSLACLGHPSRMVTTLPEHSLGDACIAELRRHGVETGMIRREPGRLGLYFLSPPAMLRPSQVIYDRADSAFARVAATAYDWPRLLDGAGWLHVSGITPALGPQAVDALQTAVATAERLGIGMSFDCNFRPTLWQGREAEGTRALAALARRATLLFGGALDVAKMFGQDFTARPAAEAFECAARVAFAECPQLEWLATTLRTTHSIDHHELTGCVATRASVVTSRRFDLQPIVDRVGAGDAFAAGVLHGRLRGFDLQRSADFGAAAGALKHSITGDFSILREADIENLLRSSRLDIQR